MFGVVVRAHSICGEPRFQCNASREVTTRDIQRRGVASFNNESKAL